MTLGGEEAHGSVVLFFSAVLSSHPWPSCRVSLGAPQPFSSCLPVSSLTPPSKGGCFSVPLLFGFGFDFGFPIDSSKQ